MMLSGIKSILFCIIVTLKRSKGSDFLHLASKDVDEMKRNTAINNKVKESFNHMLTTTLRELKKKTNKRKYKMKGKKKKRSKRPTKSPKKRSKSPTKSPINIPPISNCRIFPSDHIWNTPVDTLPVHAKSNTYVQTIGKDESLHPDFGSGLWNDGVPFGIPFITVSGNEWHEIIFSLYGDESDPGPYPIPLNAPIELSWGCTTNPSTSCNCCGDRHVIAIDTNNCYLYEMYKSFPKSNKWECGSGAVFNLNDYALRTIEYTSADAAGLPIFPGLVRYDEVESGEINHALRFTVDCTHDSYVWPARHKAGSSSTNCPPMGQRFRLKSSFNDSGFSAKNKVIITALKKYGMMVADNGSSWFLSGEPNKNWDDDDIDKLKAIKGSDFEAVDVSSLMENIDSGKVKNV